MNKHYNTSMATLIDDVINTLTEANSLSISTTLLAIHTIRQAQPGTRISPEMAVKMAGLPAPTIKEMDHLRELLDNARAFLDLARENKDNWGNVVDYNGTRILVATTQKSGLLRELLSQSVISCNEAPYWWVIMSKCVDKKKLDQWGFLKNEFSNWLQYGQIREATDSDRQYNPRIINTSPRQDVFVRNLLNSDAYKTAIDDGDISPPFTWNGTIKSLTEWLRDNQLVRETPKRANISDCMPHWDIASNVFLIKHKLVTQKMLMNATSR